MSPVIAQDLHLTLDPALFCKCYKYIHTHTHKLIQNDLRFRSLLLAEAFNCPQYGAEISCASEQEITDTQRNTQDASVF